MSSSSLLLVLEGGGGLIEAVVFVPTLGTPELDTVVMGGPRADPLAMPKLLLVSKAVGYRD